MSNYGEIERKIYNSIKEVYGSEREVKDRITKLDTSTCSPHLNLHKYQDPTGRIGIFRQTYIDCFKKQTKEAERLRSEAEKLRLFNKEKADMQRWIDRKANFEKDHHGPFFEPCPKVSEKVKDLFFKKRQEALQQQLKLNMSESHNNGLDAQEEKQVKQEIKPEVSKKASPLGGFSLIPPPPPPPTTKPPSPLLPPPPVLPTEPLPSSSNDVKNNSTVVVPNISAAAKKQDLDLFGDDEEFEKIEPVNAIIPPPQPIIASPIAPVSSQKAHKRKRSPSKSRSPVRSPKKHKKEKKEKDKKHKKEKKEKKDKDKKRDRQEADVSAISSSTRDSEKCHHKHKKHKKHDKE